MERPTKLTEENHIPDDLVQVKTMIEERTAYQAERTAEASAINAELRELKREILLLQAKGKILLGDTSNPAMNAFEKHKVKVGIERPRREAPAEPAEE